MNVRRPCFRWARPSIGQLLTWLASAGIMIATVVMPCRNWPWFDWPYTALGERGLTTLAPIMLPFCVVAVLFIVSCVWRYSPRPCGVFFYLVTAAVGLGRFMSDRYITDLYLHAQPLVAMMFLFAIVTTVEVCVRRLDKQYLIVAVALIAMTLTYWFTILIMMAGA